MSTPDDVAEKRLVCFPLESDLAQRMVDGGPELAAALTRAQAMLAEVYGELIAQVAAEATEVRQQSIQSSDLAEVSAGKFQADMALDPAGAVRSRGADPAPQDKYGESPNSYSSQTSPLLNGEFLKLEALENSVTEQRIFLNSPRSAHPAISNNRDRPEIRSMRASTDSGPGRPAAKEKQPLRADNVTDGRPVATHMNKAPVTNAEQREEIIRQIETTYGIRLDSQAGLAAVLEANPGTPYNVASKIQALRWDLETLKEFLAALLHFKDILGPRRERSSRRGMDQEVVTAALVTFGITNRELDSGADGEYFEHRRTMVLYRPRIEGKLYGKMHNTLTFTHELAHALLGYAMLDFKETYWKGIEAPLPLAIGGVAQDLAEDFRAAIIADWTIPDFSSRYPKHAKAIRALKKLRPDLFVRRSNETLDDAARRIEVASVGYLPRFGAEVGAWASDGTRYYPVERPPSHYAESDPAEDLAESTAFTCNSPNNMSRAAPLRYAFIKRHMSDWKDFRPRAIEEAPGRLIRNTVGLRSRSTPINQIRTALRASNSENYTTRYGTSFVERSANTGNSSGLEGESQVVKPSVKENSHAELEYGHSPGKVQEQSQIPGLWDAQKKQFILKLDLLSPKEAVRAKQFAATVNMLEMKQSVGQVGLLTVTLQNKAATHTAAPGEFMINIMKFANSLAVHYGSVELVLLSGQKIKVCM
ncbi:hypothetical protein [Streptomyces kaempferi]|uniref:IrrE N-terminal-like domain-containing protein n=1 Tax=Streptomyces kaempferi TaxID=333725 RepID=A0ABW3XVE7_9ACTN